MTKGKLEESEYLVIKKWYQKTEDAMDKAWGTGESWNIDKIAQVMFNATHDLLKDLAPDIDSESLSKVQANFQPFLTKAKEEFQKQKNSNVQLRFIREDGIFPAMIQSFFHAIAKYFRKDNPTVADLMEDAAKIVYQDAKESR